MNNQQTPLGNHRIEACVFTPAKWWAVLIDRREYKNETRRVGRSAGLLWE